MKTKLLFSALIVTALSFSSCEKFGNDDVRKGKRKDHCGGKDKNQSNKNTGAVESNNNTGNSTTPGVN